MGKLFSYLFLLIFVSSNGQVINGLVTRINSGNKGITGVQIIAMGATPTISKSDGTFSLTFQDKGLGASVTLQVQKDGFDIVNKKELVTYIGNPIDTLKIYLCSTGELDVFRMKYYDISVNNIRKKYLDEITRLKSENINNLKQQAALDKQLETALSLAEELAEHFSIVNLDNCSNLYKVAFHLFEDGKVQEAINALPDSIIEAQIKAANLQKEEAEMLESIASEKKGKALEVINLIQLNQNLTKRVLDSIQNQAKIVLQSERPEINYLVSIADILFCLREWESAALLYKKALVYDIDVKSRMEYEKRLEHCEQSML